MNLDFTDTTGEHYSAGLLQKRDVEWGTNEAW